MDCIVVSTSSIVLLLTLKNILTMYTYVEFDWKKVFQVK